VLPAVAQWTFNAKFERETIELIRRSRPESVNLSYIILELDIGAALLWE
jgi:hypothetical protein